MSENQTGLRQRIQRPQQDELPFELTSASTRPPTFKIYNVYDRNIVDIRIRLAGSDGTTYFADNSMFTLGKPSVTLHKGLDNKAPVIGAAKLTCFSQDNVICLGNPKKDVHDVTWENLRKTSRWKFEAYEFEFEVDGVLGSDRQVFLWRRTKLQLFHDSPSMELLVKETNEVLATYENEGILTFRKRATFSIREDIGERLELMVVLTALAIVQAARRRSRRRKYPGRGGGV